MRSLHIFTKPTRYLNIPTAPGYGRALSQLSLFLWGDSALSYHNYGIHQKYPAILPTGDFETSVCCLVCVCSVRWPSSGRRTVLPAS